MSAHNAANPRLSQVPLLFVDVETTGLSPAQGDRVCEIGLIRHGPGNDRAEWSSLVNPDRAVSAGAFAVNRITEDMLATAPHFAAVFPEFHRLCADGVWVAHNAKFDLGFLHSEYARLGAALPAHPVIDTVHLARRHLRVKSCRLGALSAHFRIRCLDAHRALGDCRTMEKVFFRIVRKVHGETDPAVADLVRSGAPVAAHPADRWRRLPASLAGMLKHDRRIKIVYVSADGQRTTRTIHVREVTGRPGEMSLVADCGLRGALRHFRLDRIIDWKPVGRDTA